MARPLVLLVLCGLLAGCPDEPTVATPVNGDADAVATADAADAAAVDAVGVDTVEVNESDGNAPDLPPSDGDAAPVTPGSWATGPEVYGGALQEHAVVAHDGLIYCLGGFRGLQGTDEMLVFDTASETWSTRASLPQAAHHVNAAVVGDTILLLGALGDGFAPFPATWRYDITFDAWDTDVLTPMPAGEERGSSAVVAIDGVVYVAGGLAGSDAVPTVSSYDAQAATWAALPPLPGKRDHLVGTAHDGRVYVAGGRTGGIFGVQPDVWMLDPADLGAGWQDRAPMPTARGGIAGASVDGVLYVFGGEGDSVAETGVFSEVEAYDLAADTWTSLPPMPTPVHGTGAAAWNGTIYIPGGGVVIAFGADDLMQVFSP